MGKKTTPKLDRPSDKGKLSRPAGLEEVLNTEPEAGDPRIGDNSIADFSNLKDVVPPGVNSDDPYLYMRTMDRMADISDEYEAAKKAVAGNNQDSGTAHRPVAEQMRELYDCEKNLVAQDSVGFENTTVRYLGIDLSAFVDLDDLGVNFTSQDFRELSLKVRMAFRRKLHDELVIATFEEVRELESADSTFEFTFRDLGSLSNEEFEGFKSRLSELLWAAFTQGAPLNVQIPAGDGHESADTDTGVSQDSDWVELQSPAGSEEFSKLLYILVNDIQRIPEDREEWVRLLFRKFNDKQCFEVANITGVSFLYNGKEYKHTSLNKATERLKAEAKRRQG